MGGRFLERCEHGKLRVPPAISRGPDALTLMVSMRPDTLRLALRGVALSMIRFTLKLRSEPLAKLAIEDLRNYLRKVTLSAALVLPPETVERLVKSSFPGLPCRKRLTLAGTLFSTRKRGCKEPSMLAGQHMLPNGTTSQQRHLQAI